MKIKLLTGFAGADFSLSPGEETDRFTDAEAARMIEAGYAARVAEEGIETATKSPAAETRASAKARKTG